MKRLVNHLRVVGSPNPTNLETGEEAIVIADAEPKRVNIVFVLRGERRNREEMTREFSGEREFEDEIRFKI